MSGTAHPNQPARSGAPRDRLFSQVLVTALLGCGLILVAPFPAGASGPSVPNPPKTPPAFTPPPTEVIVPPAPRATYPIAPPIQCVSGPTGFETVGMSRVATTHNPIHLRQGAVVEQALDMLLPGPVPGWVARRTYSSRVSGSVALGGKWLGGFIDYRLAREGWMSDVALIMDATSKRVFTYSMGAYTSPADSTLSLHYDWVNAQFVLTNWATGEVDLFYHLSAAHPGRLKERTTLAWRAAGRQGVVFSYNGSHQVTQVTTADDQEYNIVFDYTGNKLTEIEVRTGADTETRIRQVVYTYFDGQTHSGDVGSDSDLVQVTLRALRGGGDVDTPGDWIERHYQYRYDAQGLLKGVFEPDAVERLINDRADLSAPSDILAKGDDDDHNGAADHRIRDYASRWFTYYTVNVKTDNLGAGTSQDPKCVTVWAPSGENLQSKYGGSDAQEVDSQAGKYLVKTETVGGCSSCGGSGSVTYEYFYMQLDHGTPDPNEVVWLVVEDLSDAQGNGIRRQVYGLNDASRALREVTILDPVGTPQFWCRSWILEESGQKLHRVAQERTPAAHDVSASTVDEFLNPSHNGDYANDHATLHDNAGLIHVYEYNTSGDQTGERVKQGRTETAGYVAARDYYGGSKQNSKHLVTARYEYPEATTDRSAGTRITTTYGYTFWNDQDHAVIKTKTTTWPAVTTDENGSNSPTTSEEYYDSRGRLRWQKDAAGYVTYHAYHPEHGHRAYTARDVDPTSLPGSAANNATKWVPPSDGSASDNKPSRGAGLGLPTALAHVTYEEYDSQARRVLEVQEQGATVLSRHYTVYETNRHLRFPYWDASNNVPLLPIEVTAFDDSGQVTEHYAVDPARTAQSGGVPTGLSEGTNQTHYVRWTRLQLDTVTGEVLATHAYHDIPNSGQGSKDTHYAETIHGYDAQGRQDRMVAPGGTITRTVFDALGRVASQWVGTDDVPSSGTWSPSNNSGANMTKVTQYEYDLGASGGNGNRTQEIRYVSDAVEANARVTRSRYDWRDRQVFVIDAQEYDGKVTYSRVELDHLGRATKSERYFDADDDENFPADGTVDNGDRLLARTKSLHDKLGRVYRTETYAVNPTNGTVGDALVNNTWYDALGRTIKQQSGGSRALSKMTYDGLGRVTAQYLGHDLNETSYDDAGSVTGDTILEQSEMVYDAAGNVLQTTQYARKHTAGGTGALTTSSARVTYTASWYGGDGVHDRIEYLYTIQGDRLERKDQNGTVHAYDLDKLGRVTHDRVTTLGTGVDDAVRRVSTTYDIRGLREKITTHDNPTVGSGNVVNEVLFEYNHLAPSRPGSTRSTPGPRTATRCMSNTPMTPRLPAGRTPRDYGPRRSAIPTGGGRT